jgi:predicted RNA binding protein YcfA (HicA-like mRNA interferase family)
MAGKYPILKPNDILLALSKEGFVYKSQKGSHAKYSNGYRIVIILIHDTVARGTLKSILLHAGIELKDFLKLL